MLKSAFGLTARLAVEELLALLGSLVLLLTLAVLLAVPVKPLGTANVVVMVRLVLGGTIPKLQGKAVLHAPVLETKVMPLGVGSVTSTSAALLGPKFLTVMV